MATNWIIPAANDLKKVISHETRESADENTDATANSDSAYEPTLATRSNDLLSEAVVEFRQSVVRGGRYPVSVTAGAVAPEAVAHCLNWAAWRLIIAKPNFKFAIITEGGVWAPFQKLYEQACAYFAGIVAGKTFTLPTDPTGRDYLTAIDATTNPAIQSVRWGDSYGSADDYAAGQHVDSDGNITELPLDFKL